MNLYTWKYENPNNTFYWDTTDQSFIYNDFIIINSLLKFPSFNDELSSDTDFNEQKVGDYDISLSMAQGERSVNGDYIEKFFFPNDNKKYEYLIIFEPKDWQNSDDGYMRRNGFILLESMVKNIDKFTIDFKIINAIKSFADNFNQKVGDFFISDLGNPLINENHLNTFTSWMNTDFFGINSRYELDLTKLDMVTKIGYDPVVSQPLLYELLSASNPLQITKWEAFRDCATEMSFCYKLIPKISQQYNKGNYQFPKFTLYLFWRSMGLITTNLEIMSQVYSFVLLYANQWLELINQSEKRHDNQIDKDFVFAFGLVGQRTDNTYQIYNFESNHVRGLPVSPLFDINVSGSAEPSIFYKNSIFIYPVDLNSPIMIPNICIFNMNITLYNFGASQNTYLPKIGKANADLWISEPKISFARVFVKDYNFTKDRFGQYITSYIDTGNSDILLNSFNEYKFLIAGVAKNLICDIHYDFNVPLQTTFKTILPPDNKNYIITTLNNLNIDESKATITAQEIII